VQHLAELADDLAFGIQTLRTKAERHRAEEALIEERSLLHTLMDNLPDWIYFKDRQSRFTRINLALAEKFGLDHPAQAVGKTDLDFMATEHATDFHNDDAEILRTGQSMVDKEEGGIWPDGHMTWVSTTKMPLRDASGTIIGTFGVSRDITKRKQVEDALRQSEDKYRSLVSNIPDVSWTVDANQRFVFISSNMERLSGFSPDEVYQHGADLYFSSLHPDDVHKVGEAFRKLFAEGRPYDVECRVRCKNGDWIWVHDRALATYEKNGVRYADGLLSDITERKRAEEALSRANAYNRSLIESSLDPLVTISGEGSITDVNAATEKVTGFSREELIGTDFSNYFTDPDKARAGYLQVFRQGIVKDYELDIRHRDGHLTPVSYAASLYRDESGQIIGVFAAARDMTDRKRAEKALAESEALTKAIVESTSDMIWTVDSESFRLLTFNRSLEDYFLRWCGIRLQAGTTPEGHFPSEDLVKRWRGLYQRALSEGSYTTEYNVTAGNNVLQLTFNLLEREGKVFAISVFGKNITESKRAEAALLESEERFRSLVENATVGIYRTTPQGRILMANRTLISMLGHTDFATLAARNLEREGFEPGYSRREFRDRMERDAEVRGLEEMWRKKDGSVIFVRESARALRGEDGTILYYDGIVEDITERKRAEEALRRSEACLAAGESLTHTGSWSWNISNGELFWSQETYRIFGFDPAKDKASIHETFLARIHPADRARVEAGLRNPQAQDDVEYRIVLPDGSIRHVQDIAYAVTDATGKIVERFGVASDITERKRADAEHIRLVTAIEQSAEAVVITDTQGGIEYVNPAFTRITGYSREEVLGQNPRVLKSGKQDPEFYQQLWETILKGQPWHGELINRRKDGSFYTEQMSIAPVMDTNGEATHFIATKQDVTEHKVLEAQLHQAAKIEAVGRLAGGVAHDFNNLLTVINGYSELLREKLGSDTKSGVYLKEILDAGQRAASLTRQLLAFSRRQVLAPQILDLNVVVSNLEKMLRRLIGEDIKLRTILDPALNRMKADPGQIEQVIMNLAVNARDAMPTGGQLTLETHNVELDQAYARSHPSVKPGSHVMLAVSDTGVGMVPETMARIFEPFFTTKEMGKGTGLGLATVYGIVKQSGGSIWVYSEPGQGTVFKVYFPAVMESPAPAELAKTEAGSHAGTETILVVEDEEGVRSLVHEALASSGYKVLETDGAKHALEFSAKYKGPIHLLLTDVVMPQMSGPKVAEEVAALRPGIQVLYMSGYTDDAVVRHGVLSQDMPFIQKPFTPAMLRKKVREVLGGK